MCGLWINQLSNFQQIPPLSNPFWKQSLQQVSGFIDIDKINPDAWPALAADLGAGEQGIIALAFGELNTSAIPL